MTKWIRWYAREYSVQYCEVAINTLGSRTNEIFPYSFEEEIIFIPENKNQVCCMTEKANQELISACVNQFCKDKDSFQKFLGLFYKLGRAYVSFAEGVAKKDLSKLSNEEIKSIYLDYQDKLVNYSFIGPLVGFILSEYWFKKGEELIGKADIPVRDALFKPIKKSTILVMQGEASKINPEHKKAIKKFWEKYLWIPYLDIPQKPWAFEDAERFVKEAKNKFPKEELGFDEAIVKAELEDKKELFEMIRQLGYIRDARDDFRRQGIYHIQELFNEISRRAGLNLKETAYLTEHEIINFLSGEKIDSSKAKARQSGFLIFAKNNKTECFDGDISNKLKELGFKEEKEAVAEMKGTIGYKGKARGPVRIIRTVHDILKVKEGDILVAISTHPDYVIAMRKAAAIVTDEGGALSHAAIVARELGTPCVVGTKIATKILKDGDLIEVDAEHGLVKRI